MALPPSPLPAGPPPGAAPPPPAPGAAPADMAADDAGDEGGEDEVVATICKTAAGKYVLYAGDEPEAGEGDMGGGMPPGGPGMAAGGEEAAPEGKTFDTPQELMRALMGLLNDTSGAEEAFGGKSGAPGMGAPPMGGM